MPAHEGIDRPMDRARHCRLTACVAALGCALGPCGRAWAEWIADADVAFVHDSNLTRAADDDAVRGDNLWAAGASAGFVLVPSAAATLTLDVAARSERHVRYTGLDHVDLGARAFYRHKLGLGASVPYVAAALAASRDDYRDDLRDSDRIGGFVEAGRRFDAAADAAIGVGFDRRRQRHGAAVVPGVSGDVFDLRGASAWLRATLAASESLDIAARAGVRRGDVESTAHRGPAIFSVSDAVAVDRAFGESGLFAYRLRGTTWTTTLSASWALSARAAIGADYVDERTRAAAGLAYRSRISGVSLSYRW